MRNNITEKKLDNLKSFGKEDDGTYCDRYQFSIIPNKNKTSWKLYYFNEINGDLSFIKTLEDMNDLNTVYEELTKKQLQ